MDTELEARAFAREEFPVKQNSTAVSLLAGSIGGASQVIVRFLSFDALLCFPIDLFWLMQEMKC